MTPFTLHIAIVDIKILIKAALIHLELLISYLLLYVLQQFLWCCSQGGASFSLCLLFDTRPAELYLHQRNDIHMVGRGHHMERGSCILFSVIDLRPQYIREKWLSAAYPVPAASSSATTSTVQESSVSCCGSQSMWISHNRHQSDDMPF